MFKEGPYEKKKQKTHNTFSKKFLSGFSVSMVWILRTSRRGWASLFVQAWRDILEASWGFTVIFEGEPPSNSALGQGNPCESHDCDVLLLHIATSINLELECWCWTSIMPAWFLSQFRWWDDARWQLVTWSQKSEDVMLPQDATAGFYILGSLMSLAMWSRRGQHPNEPRQWYRPWHTLAMNGHETSGQTCISIHVKQNLQFVQQDLPVSHRLHNDNCQQFKHKSIL